MFLLKVLLTPGAGAPPRRRGPPDDPFRAPTIRALTIRMPTIRALTIRMPTIRALTIRMSKNRMSTIHCGRRVV
ncbi:hypothetical protein ACFVZM_24435 [Streptomyces sioyaensis]|uniref:hypothetical protein n=1 Tax=Streptomyces sioyaensis TaxID=67364 RepID=UPI00368B48DD